MTGNFEDNVISGNTYVGLRMRAFGTDVTTGNLIIGNRIGNEPTEDVDVSNGGDGIELNDSDGNTIGTANAGEQNTITGNSGDGISLDNSKNNTIASNRIGTDNAGTGGIQDYTLSDIRNSRNGIEMFTGGAGDASSGNSIIGNLLSLNGNVGIRITGATNTGNIIQGNLVGTDIMGLVDLGNSDGGIVIEAAAASTMSTVIGGTTTGVRNIISGNSGAGIALSASDGNTIQGNYIGVGLNGTTALLNSGNGITVADSNSNIIGSLTTSANACDNGCNIIAQNNSNGVQVSASGSTSHFNRITGNSIFSNTLEGIDLVSGPPEGNDDQPAPTLPSPRPAALPSRAPLTAPTPPITASNFSTPPRAMARALAKAKPLSVPLPPLQVRVRLLLLSFSRPP